MSFISDIEWQGASTFDEIDVWFCIPMLEFLKMFDEEFVMNQLGPKDERAAFYYYEMRNKVNDLQKLFFKLHDEYRKIIKELLAKAARGKSTESTDTAKQAAESADNERSDKAA